MLEFGNLQLMVLLFHGEICLIERSYDSLTLYQMEACLLA
jgi:hypothetical protein